LIKEAGYVDWKDRATKVYSALARLGDECDDSAEESEDSILERNEQVMIVKKSRRNKATGREASGVRSAASGVQASSETLGIAMSKLIRLPKPRSITDIDDIVWSTAMQTAQDEFRSKFRVKQEWDEYYSSRCEVGRWLLAEELHRRTQRIYDFRALKVFSKKNKEQVTRHKNPVASCDDSPPR